MRRWSTMLIVAGTSGLLLAGTADAAVREVRADITNASGRSVDVRIWRDHQWRKLDALGPGDRLPNVSDDSRELILWFDDCGQVALENPLVGYPSARVQRYPGVRSKFSYSEGETHVQTDDELRVVISRDDDTPNFKEFAVTLRGCPFDDPVKLPNAPLAHHRKPPLRADG